MARWPDCALPEVNRRPEEVQLSTPDRLQGNSAYYALDGQVGTLGGYRKFLRIGHAANFENPDWNSMDVVVRGDQDVYSINGRVAMCLGNMERMALGSSRPRQNPVPGRVCRHILSRHQDSPP